MKGSIRAVLLAGLLCAACSSNRPTPIHEASTLEGLQRIEVRGLDAVYVKPNADLSKYRRIMVDELDVAFSRGWERAQRSIPSTWTRADSERIKRDLSELFAEVVKNELQTKGNYELVDEAAQDVLEVRPSIIDLYITAPDVSRDSPGIVRSYTTDAGRMTLIAELRDSITGEILARVYDRREDMRSANWEWTTSITNAQKARQAIRSWARILREALDAARESDRIASGSAP